ncbi:hypothetical protein CDCA_CDCA01G0077 [Cyanidium caldarium]|uniref:Protein kinase domain-containing protein n=1 Tax=Cyanidium caldarium TaxID=2771 RepID=A0AAV9IP71_CYACA|nr:hypothetical protein CDCA_CDCA01G0077 [Cyanidium caldarium]
MSYSSAEQSLYIDKDGRSPSPEASPVASGRAVPPRVHAGASIGPLIGPYSLGRTLGTGSTGKVKLGMHTETGQPVAIKVVRKAFLENKATLKKKMQREIAVMKLCDHPNVLRLIEVFETNTHLFLVVEYADGGELFDYLVNRGSLEPDEARRFFRQIIAGVDYCHKRYIVHRDLKPENLLLDKHHRIKIADFGMASMLPPGSMLETSCGSPHYAAPEIISGEMYSGFESDVWSCGVILYALVTGKLPFDDDNLQRLLQKVRCGLYHLPSFLPQQLRSLIHCMLTVDPKRRITVEGIKAHPWFIGKEDGDEVSHASSDSRHDSVAADGDEALQPDAPLYQDPVTEPQPSILQSLVDLGWGDAATLRAVLQSEEPSLERVFYRQLEAREREMKKGTLDESDSTEGEEGARVDASLPPPPLGKTPNRRPNWFPPEWTAGTGDAETAALAQQMERTRLEAGAGAKEVAQRVASSPRAIAAAAGGKSAHMPPVGRGAGVDDSGRDDETLLADLTGPKTPWFDALGRYFPPTERRRDSRGSRGVRTSESVSRTSTTTTDTSEASRQSKSRGDDTTSAS